MNERNTVLLITDDDEGHVILVQECLRAGGLENKILTFRDGQELLDFLHGVHPKHRHDPQLQHLLLLDIRMPRLDGLETLRRIKADAALRQLPVIMLSTTDDPREIQRCQELGCGGHLTKPVEFDCFAEAASVLGFSFLNNPASENERSTP